MNLPQVWLLVAKAGIALISLSIKSVAIFACNIYDKIWLLFGIFIQNYNRGRRTRIIQYNDKSPYFLSVGH